MEKAFKEYLVALVLANLSLLKKDRVLEGLQHKPLQLLEKKILLEEEEEEEKRVEATSELSR